MAKPPLNGVAETEYTKSHIRGVPPLIYLPLSPRGDRCEHTSPTVRQLLNHGYRFETLKRRLGFAAVPCQATANLAGIDRFAQANAVGVAETGCSSLGAGVGKCLR